MEYSDTEDHRIAVFTTPRSLMLPLINAAKTFEGTDYNGVIEYLIARSRIDFQRIHETAMRIRKPICPVLYHADHIKTPEGVSDVVIYMIEDLRNRVNEALIRVGIDTMFEEGIMVGDRIKGDPSSWARIHGEDAVSKVNIYPACAKFVFGQRPVHLHLAEEFIFEGVSVEEGMNYEDVDDKRLVNGKKVAITLAPYREDNKVLLNILEEADFDRMVKIVCGAMKGSAYLHDRGYVNHDVKSGNMFLDGVLFDLETLARAEEYRCGDKFVGTPIYSFINYVMNKYVEVATPEYVDIFSYAIVLLELIMANNDEFVVFCRKSYCRNILFPHTVFDFINHIKRETTVGDDEKKKAIMELIEKMILGLGKFSLKDAIREAERICGVTNGLVSLH